jgi:predicted RNase H-like nuclease (RuvC/YqgF family)
MRELTDLKHGSGQFGVLVADHALYRLEADLRWTDHTEARLDRLERAVRQLERAVRQLERAVRQLERAVRRCPARW